MIDSRFRGIYNSISFSQSVVVGMKDWEHGHAGPLEILSQSAINTAGLH